MLYHYEHFNSIAEMLATLEEREQCPGMEGCHSSHREMDSDFCDSKTWDDAMYLYQQGKDTPREALKAIKADIDGNGVKRVRERAYAGSTCNVGRAIAGLPKDMYRRRPTPAPVKSVRLVYNSSTTWRTSAEDMERAGETFFRVAYSLYRLGYRIEIVVAAVSVSCNAYHEVLRNVCGVKVSRPKTEARGCYVTVKGYRDMFNLAKLSFALCSPSLLRRFGVLWLERAPFDATPYKLQNHAYNSGYGRPVTYNPAGVQSLKELGLWDENTRYISVYDILERGCDAERVMKELVTGESEAQ